MNDEQEESESSKRFVRGCNKFYTRYFTCSSPHKRIEYNRRLWKASPGMYLVWIVAVIVLIITVSSNNREWIIIVGFGVLVVFILTEIWVLGAPEEKTKRRRKGKD